MIGGGHTVTDPEPKYGLCVTGLADPRQIMSKGGRGPGDRLLTKPLGTGVITTAAKNDHAQPAHMGRGRLDAAAQRPRLPRVPLGGCARLHRHHRLRAARPRLRDGRGRGRALPYPVVRRACPRRRIGLRARQARARRRGRNREYLLAGGEPEAAHPAGAQSVVRVTADKSMSRDLRHAARPQTSGGLLAAVPADRVSAVRAALEDQDVPSCEIGEVLEGRGIGVV